jgi:hypothetical protein
VSRRNPATSGRSRRPLEKTRSRISSPTPDTTPAATQPVLQTLQRKLGRVPNLYATIGHCELARAREAGLTEAEVVDVIAAVTLRSFTNAVAVIAQTELDWPKAPALPEA